MIAPSNIKFKNATKIYMYAILNKHLEKIDGLKHNLSMIKNKVFYKNYILKSIKIRCRLFFIFEADISFFVLNVPIEDIELNFKLSFGSLSKML